MSEAAAIDYLKTAPPSKLVKIARLINRRLEKTETDTAIAEGRRDYAEGRVKTEAEIDELLAKKYGI